MKPRHVSLSEFSEESDDMPDLLGKLVKFKGGNSGLIEEFVYNNQPSTEEEKIPIFSGATLDQNLLGYISKTARPDNKRLKLYDGPAILVIRKGKAGKMIYLDETKFAINDDVYVIVPREKWSKKINKRWFIHQYQELFYNLVTSKSDNATFNKEYAEKQKIVIPGIDRQDQIAERLFELDVLSRELQKLNQQIERIKNSIII